LRNTIIRPVRLKTKTYFIDVRSREGGVVKKYLIFDEQISSTIPKELRFGEYVAFLADIEFKNVQFLNIFELGGVRWPNLSRLKIRNHEIQFTL